MDVSDHRCLRRTGAHLRYVTKHRSVGGISFPSSIFEGYQNMFDSSYPLDKNAGDESNGNAIRSFFDSVCVESS